MDTIYILDQDFVFCRVKRLGSIWETGMYEEGRRIQIGWTFLY